MRILLVALLALLVPAMASLARGAEGKVTGKDITITSGDEKIKGFLAVPEGKGPFPAVVVIQEWWGLNDWIKDQARRLAGEGYVCLAPDLYRGKVATDPGTASRLMKGLPHDRARGDLKAAVDALAERKDVNKDKIGVIGWCMGGGYALQLALADKRVTACAICYGRVETDADKLASLNASVLGIFGKEDKGIPIASVRQFGKALSKAGKTSEGLHEYEAGHGFMREKNGERDNPEYRAEPARKAWQEIDKFFAKTLKGR
jgi:carboxymethylenebutenolidase